MNSRQEQLFKIIVEEYVKIAMPVGSKLIVDKHLKNVSSATVRNDMVELENMGLISHPHTSAGRIPTEQGYSQYVDDYVDLGSELSEREKGEIEKSIKSIINNKSNKSNKEDLIRFLAKILAEKSGLAVVVGFGKNNVYYTGLSNLFSQPEFEDLNLIYNISKVVDHLDEVMRGVYDEIDDRIQIKIGKRNPFSSDCACVIVKVKDILIGVLGPMRMEYQRCVSLINFFKTLKH